MASQLQYVSQARGPAFVSSVSNRRFLISHQTPTTTITAQTGWVATTPTFIFYKTSSQTTKRLVVSLMGLEQTGVVAGGPINIIGAIDPTNRYSAGGTAVTPQITTTQQVASGSTPEFSFRYNATASAAGTGDDIPRYFNIGTFPAETGSTLPTVDFQDEIILNGPSSFLVYIWAATTAPTLNFTFECWEEDIRGDM